MIEYGPQKLIGSRVSLNPCQILFFIKYVDAWANGLQFERVIPCSLVEDINGLEKPRSKKYSSYMYLFYSVGTHLPYVRAMIKVWNYV